MISDLTLGPGTGYCGVWGLSPGATGPGGPSGQRLGLATSEDMLSGFH